MTEHRNYPIGLNGTAVSLKLSMCFRTLPGWGQKAQVPRASIPALPTNDTRQNILMRRLDDQVISNPISAMKKVFLLAFHAYPALKKEFHSVLQSMQTNEMIYSTVRFY